MSDFRPGVDRMRAAGYAVQAGAYPEGQHGIALSIEELGRKIRDGRLDADVRGWAGDVVIAAGRPTRVRDQAQALADAFRQETMYLSDPVASEFIVGAAGTACLRPGLCVRARDCDDGVVFLGSALMSIGIPIMVVKQTFGPDAPQEHVLVEARDENGLWFAIDPSTDLPLGEKVRAFSEQRINPMDLVGSLGTKGQEIVTLGAVRTRDVHFDGVVWRERRYGREYVFDAHVWREVDSRAGLGGCDLIRIDTGLGQSSAATPWQPVTDRTVKPGLRYRVGFLVSALGAADPRIPAYADARSRGQATAYLTGLLSKQWLVESLAPTGAVHGGTDSWQLVGISKVDGTMQDDAFYTTTSLEVQASSAPPAALPTVAPVVVPEPPPSSGTISAPVVVLSAVGVGVAGGIAWGLYRRKKRAA